MKRWQNAVFPRSRSRMSRDQFSQRGIVLRANVWPIRSSIRRQRGQPATPPSLPPFFLQTISSLFFVSCFSTSRTNRLCCLPYLDDTNTPLRFKILSSLPVARQLTGYARTAMSVCVPNGLPNGNGCTLTYFLVDITRVMVRSGVPWLAPHGSESL